MNTRIAALGAVLALAAGSSYVSIPVAAQSKTAKPATAQKVDEEYTRLIKQNLQDPRITTELVDHLPASDTVPSPLKFLGRAVGAPGELTYAKDIYRYYEALAKAAPTRAKYWKVGATEEGRDIVLLAIGDENAIKNLDKYRDMLGELTDPRKTTEARAQQQQLHTAKPIYYAISGMHSPETGGPEMLIELAYRLIVEETPFIHQSPVLNASGGGRGGFGGGGGRGGEAGTNPNGGIGQNVTPNALPLRIQPFEADTNAAPSGHGERPPADDLAQMRQMAQQ